MDQKPKAIFVGMSTNPIIAASKFTAAFLSDRAAMVSEGIHSFVDTGDGALLLYGLHRSQRPADDAHPFDHGKELCFWTFVVSMLIFAGGGIVSSYQGSFPVVSSAALGNLAWNDAILAISALAEGYSFRVEYREFRSKAGTDEDLLPAIHDSKNPSTFAILFEDGAALAGLPFFGIIAAGEGARQATLRKICELVEADPAVDAAGRPLTMYLGPETVLLALDVRSIAPFRRAMLPMRLTASNERSTAGFLGFAIFTWKPTRSLLCFAPIRTRPCRAAKVVS